MKGDLKSLGASLREEMLVASIWAAALVLIAALVALYLLKKRSDSQYWRVRAPMAAQRTFTFLWWLIVKKVPWRPILIWGPWVAIVSAAAYYIFADWHGKRRWEAMERELVARGELLDLDDFESAPIPDENNFAMHPAFLAEVALKYPLALGKISNMDLPGVVNRFEMRGPRRGARTDIRQWLVPPHRARSRTASPGRKNPAPAAGPSSEKAAAEELLTLLVPVAKRMEEIAEAAQRPDCRLRWDRSSSAGPADWDLAPGAFDTLGMVGAFGSRALLRSRAGDPSGALDDLAVCVRVAGHLEGHGPLLGLLIRIANAIWIEEVAWDLVQDPEIDLERLRRLIDFADKFDPCREFFDAMRCERAWVLAVLEHGKGSRQEISDFLRWGPTRGLIDLVPDWSPDELDDLQEEASVLLLKIGPSGWFSSWKADYARHMDRAYFQSDGVEAERVTVESVARAISARERLPDSFSGGLIEAFEQSSEQLLGRVLYAQARMDLMRTGIALERHRRERGAYPATLRDLVPEFLPEVPIDLASGKALIYRLKPDGTPLVYSIGLNQVDDGGWPSRRAECLDWVWQLTPTEGQTDHGWQWGTKP